MVAAVSDADGTAGGAVVGELGVAAAVDLTVPAATAVVDAGPIDASSPPAHDPTRRARASVPAAMRKTFTFRSGPDGGEAAGAESQAEQCDGGDRRDGQRVAAAVVDGDVARIDDGWSGAESGDALGQDREVVGIE